jgi:predicted TPR repeat methyltransferase
MAWDAYAAGWDDQPGVRAYARAAFGSLLALAEASGFDLAGSRACDFGCGTGLLTEQLVDLCDRIDAVDSSPAMLEILRGKIAHHGWDNVRVFDRLPQPPDPYDLVVCSSVCAFVDDYPGLVNQLVSSMRPGGLFVQWDWERDSGDDEPFGLTREAVRHVLGASGLVSPTVGTGFEISVDGQTMKPLMGAGRSPH